MNPKQADGTFRGPRQPAKLSEAYLRARWVEEEALALKKSWVSYGDIATHISRVGGGEEKSVKPVPPEVVFSPGYSISKQAVHKAVAKALARESASNVEEFRQLACGQSEESLKYLQADIRKGDPKAISTSMKVIDVLAKLKGAYRVDNRPDPTQGTAGQHPLTELLKAIGTVDEDEEKAA